MSIFHQPRITTIGWALVVLLGLGGAFFISTALISKDKISDIQATWNTFEEGRSEKAGALDALHQEIGYGGMIHNFKNYILGHETKYNDLVKANIGGARAALSRYRTLGLNEREKQALGHVEKMLGDYQRFLVIAERLILAGLAVREIDRLVTVDDTKALASLGLLNREIFKSLDKEHIRTNKPRIITALHLSMGYSGMIHLFKNYVLRDDHSLLDKLNAKMSLAHTLIGQYRQLPMTGAELGAIQDILATLKIYEKNLEKAFRLTEEGVPPQEIDKVIKVDDQPALRAFVTLIREIAAQNEAEAKKVGEAFELVSGMAIYAIWISFTLTVLLISASLWMTRTRLVAPIKRMTGIMTRLAGGDLEIPVTDIAQDTEIGEMARAIEVFRINAIERRRARGAAQRMGRIVEESVNEIYIFDAETLEYIDVNRSGRENLGYSLEELSHLTPLDLNPEFTPDSFETLIWPLRSGKVKTLHYETVHRRKDDSRYPVEVNLQFATRETPPMFVAIIQDITERQQAEKAKKEFVSTVSHELRTPLTSIMGALGLIRGGNVGELSDEMMSMLDIAYSNSNRLVRLINDILDIEKIEAGKMEFKFRPVRLGPFLERAIESNEGFAEKFGVQFILSNDLPEAKVSGDYDRLVQALTNLLSNAVKFSPKGSTVEISLSRSADTFRIAVKDQGPGISDGFKEKIFQKFSQADSTDTRHKGGTGLGLNITKAIVEGHGGNIGFENLPEKGTMFYIDLPQSRDILAGKPSSVVEEGC
ncbi:MAG: ATP-binding protein [Proteobacteria bacterium]|nr:ATP-binding protein [Pseudomonadota bacterium]MDA1021892.1 ATP-binding protein [Pseudomonadota bacterium]